MADKAALRSWSTGFCSCCDDCGSCCLTLWCPCVSFGRIAEITDRGTTSCCAQGTIFCILGGFTQFVSLYACIYRTKLRRLYGIQGSQGGDCLVSCCCPTYPFAKSIVSSQPVDSTCLKVGRGMSKCVAVASRRLRRWKVA